MDAIAESAARLCGANDALIFRLEGDSLKRFANFGSLPGELGGGPRGIDQNSIPGRAVIAREIIHIHDLAAVPETELPALFARRLGVRTALATPLLREGSPIGVIMIRRTEVRPFTTQRRSSCWKLLPTKPLSPSRMSACSKSSRKRWNSKPRRVKSWASLPVHRRISSRINTVAAENAAQLCEATDAQIRLVEADGTRLVASFGTLPAPKFFSSTSLGSPTGRAILKARDHTHP